MVLRVSEPSSFCVTCSTSNKKHERETRGARNEFQSCKHPLSSPRNENDPDPGRKKLPTNSHGGERGRSPPIGLFLDPFGWTNGKGKRQGVSLRRRNPIVVPPLNGFEGCGFPTDLRFPSRWKGQAHVLAFQSIQSGTFNPAGCPPGKFQP